MNGNEPAAIADVREGIPGFSHCRKRAGTHGGLCGDFIPRVFDLQSSAGQSFFAGHAFCKAAGNHFRARCNEDPDAAHRDVVVNREAGPRHPQDRARQAKPRRKRRIIETAQSPH